uniref:Uncharacterized protein n=1 Tax=Neobodo designis TaxID=312471 RepID=A0A7S1W5G9_NEODS|mmetsp:Transcript_53190/g.163666  ORF Transcript_53190/g.163666 Transcript_53190/m.163666 type:complete len:234 (+) Transcript_53190:46-747(+)|eukprot:CAMPEP_0174843500 /NCGR_PEP_ID=MMETSP1114-20130205/10560_1 /TAXON_ID=312471 /ORGANISM="Neobodo designis, Strain CCAP 1951/1" /LENGTH=233 /DNA_ID=CAMNT_0016077725 /DNA_START=47 /DNA_END=748 /DNA_ORIENTATION=+
MRALSLLSATVAVVTLSLAASLAHAWQPWPPGKKPAFCNSQDCPVFDTLLDCSASRGFTVRRYPAGQQWVSIDFEGPGIDTYDSVGDRAFNHLFDYITGANAANASIKMTDPVPIDIFAGATPTCNTTFRVSFYISDAFQGKAPQPTGKGVYLRTNDEFVVVQRSFSGFASSWNWIVFPELEKLASALNGTNIEVKNRLETAAQYDGPFQLFNRHNEVWLYVDNTTAPSTWTC